MRTDDEVVARIEATKGSDMFGFATNDLLETLPFERAKPYLKDGATPELWAEAGGGRPRDRVAVVERIRDYMPFAWEKANGCRGLSAMRSLMHMQAWLWLLGEDAAAEGLGGYTHYGKPQLRAICERLDIDWRALDDGRWREGEADPGVPALPAVVLPWRC